VQDLQQSQIFLLQVHHHTGLFFFFAIISVPVRSISLSLPTQDRPTFFCCFCKIIPKLSNTGVSDDDLGEDGDDGWPLPGPPKL